MRVDSTRGRKSLVQDFLVKRVLEGIAARDRIIRPFGHAGRDHNAARPRQFLAKLFDVQDVAVHRARDQQRRELGARSACDFEQTPLLGGQLIDLPRDHFPQIARHADLRNRLFGFHLPLSVDLDDRPLRNEMIDERGHEQRLSAGPRKDAVRPMRWRDRSSRTAGQDSARLQDVSADREQAPCIAHGSADPDERSESDALRLRHPPADRSQEQGSPLYDPAAQCATARPPSQNHSNAGPRE